MKRHFITAALAATALLLGASLSWAVEDQPATGEASSKSTPDKTAPGAENAKAAKGAAKPKHKPAAVSKVYINSAKKDKLKKLPGVGNAEADKIIAGRPYCSRKWLLYYNVISDELYASIEPLIEVGRQFMNDPKNIEICKKSAQQRAVNKK